MSKNKLITVMEQEAIFDGKPDFMPMSALINLLNHNSWGDDDDTSDLVNPKRYKVQLHLYVEEVDL